MTYSYDVMDLGRREQRLSFDHSRQKKTDNDNNDTNLNKRESRVLVMAMNHFRLPLSSQKTTADTAQTMAYDSITEVSNAIPNNFNIPQI